MIILGTAWMLLASSPPSTTKSGKRKSKAANQNQKKKKQRESKSSSANWTTTVGSFQVLETWPHNESSFTQGLLLCDPNLDPLCYSDQHDTSDVHFYESSGLYTESVLRTVHGPTGATQWIQSLDDGHFAEGIEVYSDKQKQQRLIQLTWQNQTALIYDRKTLQLLETKHFKTTTTEGWGIAYRPDTNQFLVSDGSPYIHKWDVETLKEVSKIPIEIHLPQMPEPAEMKYINDLSWDARTKTLLANIWYQDALVRIDVDTGRVVTLYPMPELYVQEQRTSTADSFNGVAVDTTSSQEKNSPTIVYTTGKKWPYMYRLRLVEGHE